MGDENIVIISQKFPPDQGANSFRIRDMAEFLDSRGWNVSVLAPPACYPHNDFDDRSLKLHDRQERDGITIHRLWSWQPKRDNPPFISRLLYYSVFSVVASIWVLLYGSRYDVLLTTYGPITTELPGFFFKLTGGIWVADIRDVWIENAITLDIMDESSYVVKLSRAFQKKVLERADLVSHVTDGVGVQLQDLYRISSDKMVLVPNGANTSIFTAQSDRETRNVQIIYTGNVGPAYDWDTCIEAMTHVDNSSLSLKLVGSGDHIDEVKELVDKHGVHKKVTFEDSVPQKEVANLMQRSLIGIAPVKNDASLQSAVPVKVYEYMASGLPVIGTGSGALRRFLNESGAGIFVANNPLRLAESINLLVSDTEKWNEYSSNGPPFIKRNHSREIHFERLNNELMNIL